jgi:transcriptional regulator with PAS, ATPase and Fis domain
MPQSMQIKLMRILQEKEIEPIGSDKPKHIDFRLISATNRDLEALISEGEFRLDLFYRINLMTISLPPLRKIKNDIPLLVNHFLNELGSRKKTYRLSEEAMTAMTNYSWPGNIRELRNVIERAVIVCSGKEIMLNDLPAAVQRFSSGRGTTQQEAPFADLRSQLEDAEKKAVIQALDMAKNNKSNASKLLGIHRTGLYQKMKKYELL